MKLEKLNSEQQYLVHDFDVSDYEYCDKEATELVSLDLADVLNDDGKPMTFSDWWTVVARERAKTIERVRGMYCGEMGVE